MDKNRYGLSRNIPEKIKRTVRKNSRFGCILCRSAIYTYEHIDPVFIDARSHDPDRITLLCPTCHALVTKGRIPKEHISAQYDSIKKNINAKRPTDLEFFAHYGQSLTVNLGPCEFHNYKSIINIDGIDVLSYKKCNTTGAYAVTGLFNDQFGKELFRIVDNEWIGPVDAWDVEQVGCRLTIRSSPKNIAFEAIKDNDKSTLNITRLDMHFYPFHVIIESGIFLVGQYDKNKNGSLYFEVDGTFNYGDCALYLDSSRSSQLSPSSIRIIGGKGAWIEGTGIWVGFGSGPMWLKNIKIYNNGCAPEMPAEKTKPQNVSPDQNYFIVGVLETLLIEHPLWKEEEYYINGQKLNSKPYSWGEIRKIDENSLELFHISRFESEDLTKNSGFIGFYADDVLKQDWSDRVFELEIEEEYEEGVYIRRVKRYDIEGRRIINEVNPTTGKPFHPQEFMGTSPWKKKE